MYDANRMRCLAGCTLFILLSTKYASSPQDTTSIPQVLVKQRDTQLVVLIAAPTVHIAITPTKTMNLPACHLV